MTKKPMTRDQASQKEAMLLMARGDESYKRDAATARLVQIDKELEEIRGYVRGHLAAVPIEDEEEQEGDDEAGDGKGSAELPVVKKTVPPPSPPSQ